LPGKAAEDGQFGPQLQLMASNDSSSAFDDSSFALDDSSSLGRAGLG
jgi:hypothetical protein